MSSSYGFLAKSSLARNYIVASLFSRIFADSLSYRSSTSIRSSYHFYCASSSWFLNESDSKIILSFFGASGFASTVAWNYFLFASRNDLTSFSSDSVRAFNSWFDVCNVSRINFISCISFKNFFAAIFASLTLSSKLTVAC